MAITNLNNDHFNEEQKKMINEGWDMIMKALSPKARNLSGEERQKYGSVKEENKLVVQKVLDYNQSQPHLSCPDVDYKELQADWNDRMFLSGLLSRMVETTNIVNSIRITHDFDAYNSAKVDYNHCKYKMGTNDEAAGFESKYKDLLYFFKTNTASPDKNKDGKDEVPTEE
jgi:hypothetical protein